MATVREALNASRSRPAACYTGGSRGGRIRMLVRLSILVLLLCMSQTLAQVPPDTSPLAPIAPAPPPSAPVVRQVPPPPTLAPVPSDDYRDPANRGKIHRGLRM
jgi:hypothetical protein